MTEKVLVSGSSGFIGSYVVDRLLESGREVLAFDRSGKNDWRPGVQSFLGDIRDETAVNEAMAHCDSYIHLAGVLGTAETIQNPRPAADTNIRGGLNFLEAATEYKLPGIIIAVGNYWENNTYSITKSTVERFAQMFRQYRGTQVSVVRALNAYGPGQSAAAPYGHSKVRKITPSFVCRALSGDPIEVYSDPVKGSSKMDMVYVGDVADILVRALDWTSTNGPIETVLEAGTGIAPTVDEIAQAVVRECGKGTITHLPMRAGETPGAVVVADTSTLAAIDYPVDKLIQFEDGIKPTVEYFKEYLARERS